MKYSSTTYFKKIYIQKWFQPIVSGNKQFGTQKTTISVIGISTQTLMFQLAGQKHTSFNTQISSSVFENCIETTNFDNQNLVWWEGYLYKISTAWF